MFNMKNLFDKEKVSDTNKKPEKVKLLCNHCNTVNNVDVSKLGSGPVCGNCKNKLIINASPLNGSNANFEKEVLQWPGIVLVDFWATWCPPCKMIAPVLESISKEKAGEIKIVKVNTDQEGLLSAKYQISSIPTLILFENGRQINRIAGAIPKQKLLEWVYSSI